MNMIDFLKVIIVFLLVGSISIYAIGNSDVSLSTPVSGIWVNESNYTTGYAFSWSDTSDNTYATANCTLYVGDTDLIPSLVVNTYIQESVIASEDTTHTLFQLADFVSNSSALYWTVKCYNSTSIANRDGWSPTARTIYQDNVTPTVDLITTSITNNTWTNTNTVRIEVNMTDTGYEGSESMDVYILARSTLATLGSTTTTDQIQTNVTATLGDGNHTLTVKVCDPALNCNVSLVDYGTYIDTTAPVVAYIDPTIVDDGNTSMTYVEINFSVVEPDIDTIVLTWSGTDESISPTANCTGISPKSCFVNKTKLSAQRELQYSINVTDEADNEGLSGSRNISIDLAGTAVTTENNWTVTDSVLNFTILVTDTTPYSCYARIYDRDSVLQSTITAGFETIGATTNCSGLVSASDISTEGAFTVEYYVIDEVGNTGLGANQSGVLKNMYSGWNLITWTDDSDTVYDICESMDYCTQVSWFNNTAQAYTTYSIATPSVNNDTDIDNGDAVYVYVSADDYLLMNDHLPASGTGKENITLTIGWNTFGLLYNTTMNSTLSVQSHNATEDVLSWASNYDGSAESYLTCGRSAQLCTSTSDTPDDIILRKGYAVWVLSEYTDTIINRTSIKG